MKYENIFRQRTNFKFSRKLSAHTLIITERIIIENFAENIKLVWFQKLCIIFVTILSAYKN